MKKTHFHFFYPLLTSFALLFVPTEAYNSFSSKGFAMEGKPIPSFGYDLQLSAIPGISDRAMICLHGFGGNSRLAYQLKVFGVKDSLITFNFPDHDIKEGYNPEETTFGSIEEILPALYVLKNCIIDKKIDQLTLYGFSAGAGALINTIRVLNTSNYDFELKKIGILTLEKKQILDAIQKSIIILDTPLKSVEEIIDFRGSDYALEVIAERYRDNDFVPIDSLRFLANLSLNIIVHFQTPDEILSNRDDNLFIERLKKYNSKGKTSVVIASDGGHNVPHSSLWKFYANFLTKH